MLDILSRRLPRRDAPRCVDEAVLAEIIGAEEARVDREQRRARVRSSALRRQREEAGAKR